jgi:trigger factor
VRGLSAGESATFTSRLVAGEYADRDAEVTVTVTAVKERELPPVDEEFAQLVSEFDTLDELRDSLRTQLGRARRFEQLTQARDKVLEAILDTTEVPLPESVVTAEVESQLHNAVHAFDHDEARFAQFLEAQGKTREEFDADVRTAAERSVTTQLVLDALAEKEKVSVTNQELTEWIITQAQQYQVPPEELARRFQEAGQLGAVFADIRRSKALIAAVGAATVTDAAGAAVDLSELIEPDDDAVEVVEVPSDGMATAADEPAPDGTATAGDEPAADEPAVAADGAADEVPVQPEGGRAPAATA